MVAADVGAGAGPPSLGQRKTATHVAMTVALVVSYGQKFEAAPDGFTATGWLKFRASARLACSTNGSICASADQRYCWADVFAGTGPLATRNPTGNEFHDA